MNTPPRRLWWRSVALCLLDRDSTETASPPPRWILVAPMFLLATITVLASEASANVSMDPNPPLALLGWDDSVGRLMREEGDSEGPKSFALAPGGGLLILDQVNLRILKLDPEGDVVGAIELPGSTFDDLAVFEDRALLVLDRLGTRSLFVLDGQGARLAEVPLEGHGIPHSGLVTAMFALPDGVWLEIEHRYSVRILDRHLEPAERRVVLGRPTARGKCLRAALDGDGGVTLSVAPPNGPPDVPEVTLAGSSPIHRVVWLDQAADGRIGVVLHQARRDPKSPFRVTEESYVLVMLDEELRELGRSESPWVLIELHQRAEFRLGPNGELWQMAFTPLGVALRRFSPVSP